MIWCHFYFSPKRSNSDFQTPTDDITELKWPEAKPLSSSLPDSGVLSDSALDETDNK